MATYCFKCDGSHDPSCDLTWRGMTRDPSAMNKNIDGHVFVRDYRAENVGASLVALKRERERGGPSAVRDLFLPTANDFKGPGDPDGAKGLRTWADEHEPKMGNKKPLYPEGIPRRSW